MKNIGIIGSGQVAKALAKGFAKHGYQVMISSREPSKLLEWQTNAGDGISAGTFEEAAKFGDLVVLAVKGSVAANAVELAAPGNLEGKTIIDTTNPIADAPPQDGVLKFTTSLDHSLMEELQLRFPAIHFVKAFNSVGNAVMVDPSFKEGKPTMFTCGNDEEAKKEVHELLEEIGWEVADMGKAAAARAIEPLCMLWCIPGFMNNQWSHAFKLLKG